MPLDIDILNQGFRNSRLGEILGDENRRRKEDAKTRFEVLSDRQDRFVRRQLIAEFGPNTVKEMRIISSINLTKRIVNEQASIYNEEPVRTFVTPDGKEATENELKQILNLYEEAKANIRLKKSNKYFKLQDQCTIQVWPRNGVINMRVLQPHQYDVIPDPLNPEIGLVYILNVMDDLNSNIPIFPDQDRVNQGIADRDDAQDRAKMRFIWWSANFNFTTDGNGKIVTTFLNEDGAIVEGPLPNPIGRLPFIDVADDKDFEFWVRLGKNIVGFNLDFSAMLSDTATINKIQGYAQAVVTGSNTPENLVIGPTRVLRLPTSPEDAVPPTFDFVSPSPDLASALDLLDRMVNLFLTSEGLDPATISSKGEATRFSSGVERFLSELTKFKATKNDFDIFRDVEKQLFELFRLWSNGLQQTDALNDNLKMGKISEDLEVLVEFNTPEMLLSTAEREESIIRRLDKKLISRIEAIAEDRDITEEQAEEVIKKMDEQAAESAKTAMETFGLPMNRPPEKEEEGDGEEGRDTEDDVQGESE